MIAAGFRETFRGQAWSRNCREWVYFDCLLDRPVIRDQMDLPNCVVEHSNDDSKSGRESGFVCEHCRDAVMGLHPGDATGKPRFP
ncbi:MAG: hypothetical protein ACYSWU_04545 [Planctomycetota bacterium]